MTLKKESKKNSLMTGIFVALYLYIFIVLSSYYLFAGKSSIIGNPHNFMKEKNSCAACHIDDPQHKGEKGYRMVNFKKDIYSLCTSCHKPDIHHPIDIMPGKRFSRVLPLDPDGSMTCTTCHDPHGKPYGDKPKTGRRVISKLFDLTFPISGRKYPTYFLRVSNVGGKLCLECHTRISLVASKHIEIPDTDKYITSKTCAKCHPENYRLWKVTSHARMVRRPGRDNGALLADLSLSNTLALSNIVYVLGNHWIQRFVSQKDDTLVVRTPIWIIQSNSWDLSYWREYNWIKSCAGCHVTGLNPYLDSFVEAGVGCESCHGPGRKHARSGSAKDIVNPAKLDESRRSMICESCHTTGHDRTGEFRFPVGYTPGSDLTRFFFGLQPRPGQDDESFHNDGSYEDRHRQFIFWLNTYIYTSNDTCDLCKNFRFEKTAEKRALTEEDYCKTCHRKERFPIPHGESLPRNLLCVKCHQPKRNGFNEYSIHDHKFIPPSGKPK